MGIADDTSFFDLTALNREHLAQRTLDQVADDFHDLKQLKNPETARRYRREIAFFFAFMRRFGADPATATQPHVVRYLAYLASDTHPQHPGDCWSECAHLPYAPASRQHRLDVLNAFYAYAIANGLPLAANPCTGLFVVVPAKTDVDHLTEWELHDLWNAVREHSHRDAALIALLAGCGLRKEEARRVRIENFGKNAFGPTLHFYRVKGGYWQTINLPAPAWKALAQHIGDRTRGPLLASRTKAVDPDTGLLAPRHLTDAGIDYILHQVRAYSGVRPDDLYAHLLRYTSITFARTLKGLPVETTMTYYGHASRKDHTRYDAHARDTFVHEIINPIQGRGFWRLAA